MTIPIRSVLLTLLLSAGCGQQNTGVVPVDGLVLFNGKPARAEITFRPDADEGHAGGRASTATTDSSGRFQMTYSPDVRGATVGRHQVTIKVLPDAPGNSFAQATTPVKIVRLVREVRSRDNSFNFLLGF